MGSSFSLQSKDKRRRSNRLSKPPQNQAVPGCSDSLSSWQLDQALSLPSTPTLWQNPWTGVSVPISPKDPKDPKDAVPPNPRSQSVSSTPVRRTTTWNSNKRPIAGRNAHSSADIWSQSPASPGPAPSRRESVYGRTSFHPSEIATFQPTTLQSNPQSPLMGQPKRSYSVHSPPQNPKNGVQRRTLDKLASINSHSRVNSQESLPIRRRSLLIRPGVATRKATKSIPPTFFSGQYQNETVPPAPRNTPFTPTEPAFITHEGIVYNDLEPLSSLRPPTPSDHGYTHLGALKLGSLRVVNGSASPCPSDRTRLCHTGSPTPEAISETMNSTDLLRPVEGSNCGSRPTSPGGLEIYVKKCPPVFNNARDLDHVMGGFPREVEKDGVAMTDCQVTPGKNDIPATTLNIPSAPSARNGLDFPISPFSFDESPTSDIPHRRAVFREAEDEGISISEKERVPTSVSEKVPERNLSYSSHASSHRKMDSGYSSATSHRTSIDSHASLRRAPGFRKFALGDSARDFESHDANTPSTTDYQNPVNHRPMLQDKLGCRPDFCGRPMSVSRIQRDQPQIQVNGRARGLSLPLPRASGDAACLPLYCAHNLESTRASTMLPSIILGSCDPGTGQVDESLCWACGLGGASYPYSTLPTTQMGCLFEGGANQGANFGRHSADHHDMHNKHHCTAHGYRTRSEHGSRRKSFSAIATRQHHRHSGGVKSDIWLPVARNNFLSYLTAEQPNNGYATEPLRGRTRSRAIAHQYPGPSEQQPSYFC
ncbi:uncharacterized protein APUU_41168S [Aspergillus puulaauensis]|uniref:Uncharacterized protein n=1 Tax=Aspergillus puulaauensis TaxID=1220207 RepID=A0A7R7XNZ1_9EURO|nr:uncharacterized protein APUU_41168S [Aspergillus puulaauensis]BCS24724.1 hypothetical protein APUU_41168S [Aspergillus puulaauensis]